MVEDVRHGASFRTVAGRFGVGLSTVHHWVRRAGDQLLDDVDWADRPHTPRTVQRTDRALEDLVLTVRQELRELSALGEYGSAAIHREMVARGVHDVPAVRTIGRILERRGALDARRRVRRPPPPVGWYLPNVANRGAELDSFDLIEGLVIEGGVHVEVLTGIALHSGLPVSWPMEAVSARFVNEALIQYWQAFGLPAYAQFDNDTRFQGAHQHPDSIGRVVRLCLSLGVVPVFVPPRETGFQAAIESFNARWQAKVWERFHHDSLAALQARSDQYLTAYRLRSAARADAAPPRRPFPVAWQLDLQAGLRGRVVYLRRTDDRGEILLLGRRFAVDPLWLHRLVRAEVDFDAGHIRFYALRRREPSAQPLFRTVPYTPPRRRFHE